ncbi:MAG: tRNA (uridine(34)/cytosine(34)/5-carboxymethylaminomethyluridine(34)-2'-O)-methyltransferase TrmL [Firmicutes bacterium]|nr:tRNA (uridine(34)/cytosine(34)/5-carboxymethylaminomethyluridine(34)-2'-O)-methyltransferase TrmL [Bacillota bacterium]MDO4859709.1 tRNA (uridine(34)/cytosine(34)/5-carboxymethylaminomethyluridine(34)-2'-O)-methyltransferase TrmL [Bacillota bacterium]
MALHIVLVEPEIPPNTGNIARSCAITGSELHLVRPLGFSIDDKSLKRAGLDYWPYVKVHVHDDLDSFMKENEGRRMFFATTKGARNYSEVEYKDGDMILFGRETRGLPKELISRNIDRTIRIPMSSDTRLRSLNLSNSAAIVLYEALRQLGFPGLK